MLELDTNHLREVTEESAILPDVAEARGYRTLTGSPADRDLLEGLGFKPFLFERDDAYPGLLVPMHNVRGEQSGAQFKPAVPRERVKSDGRRVPVKYESPSGAPLVVDVPAFTRAVLTDLSAPLWITEGMKKTDALVSQGVAALGLTGVFNWRNKMGTLGDWEDIPLKGRVVVLCFDADAATNRNVQNAMGRLGAWLRTKGASKVHYVVPPAEVNGVETKGVDDFFAAGGTLPVLAAAESPTPPGQGAADAAFTDAFLVEDLASEALEGRFAWASGLGWLRWNGTVWAGVSDVEPLEAVRQWAAGRFDAVLEEQKRDQSKNLGAQINGWRGVLSRSRIQALSGLARGVQGVQCGAEDFDADPDLLTVKNGTLHLPTGGMRPHDPADRITKCAGAEYRKGYTHPMWTKALSALPEEVHSWYADRHGQAVTGYKTPDHMMVIGHGGGMNGKSTLTNIMNAITGSYGGQISDRVLMASPDAHPTELMDLRGLRYAVLEETPPGAHGAARHLNVHRLKQTLGTEHITARRIRQDSVTFKATHSLFINTNHKPVISETDHGTWRRLSLLVFPYTYRSDPRKVVGPLDRLGDPRLEYVHEDPDVCAAALAWVVEGARAWYDRDRRMMPLPESVVESTQKWREDTDLVLGFLGECLELDPAGFVTSQDMLTTFNSWVEDRGHRPWNAKTFGDRFGTHETVMKADVVLGRKYFKGKQQRGWTGVQVTGGVDPFQ